MTEFHENGNILKVLGPRGGLKYTITFDAVIVSAVIRGDTLVVELADQRVRAYDVPSGKLAWEDSPTPPSGGYGEFALAA